MRRMVCVGVLALTAGRAWADSDVSNFFPTLTSVAPLHLSDGAPVDRTPAKYTIYWENDGGWIKPLNKQDRHYTNGIAMSFSARPKWARDLGESLPSFGKEFAPGHGERGYAVGFVAVQDMYTPENYEQRAPDHTDWPYGGLLYGGGYLQRARYYGPAGADKAYQAASYEHTEIDLGMIGPSSLAKQAQEAVHDAFHYEHPRGWANQVHDEPVAELKYVRKWRWSGEPSSSLWPTPQVIPEAGLIIGNVHRELDMGATFRVVWGAAPDDFGADRMHLPKSFTASEFAGPNFTVFGRPSVRFVEHNAMLEGNSWRSSTVTQDIEPVVGEFQVGVTAQVCKLVELGYSWTFRSPEFDGQKGWDSVGAWTVSFVWAF